MNFHVWGMSGTLMVDDPGVLERATTCLWRWIDAIDASCNRFRSDSEISRLNATPGEAVALSPVLELALEAALRSSDLTQGLCDPTLLPALRALGYDRDFDELALSGHPDDNEKSRSAHLPLGVHALHLDTTRHTVRLEPGVGLDLGASAKALTADLVVRELAEHVEGVLVEIGGDVALRGAGPEGPWVVGIGDTLHVGPDLPRVSFTNGGIATSSVKSRTWRVGSSVHHHIIDPRTGRPATGPYATATVSAPDCVSANALATAALVWGEEAGYHIAQAGWSARLVRHDGSVDYVGGWPHDLEVVA